MNRSEVRVKLLEHLQGEGALNDWETERLFRDYYLVSDIDAVDLETIEKWAVDLLS